MHHQPPPTGAGVELRLVEPQWVCGAADDPTDLCAHGRVSLRAGDCELVRPADGVWTVSAAGLFLLRAATDDHPEQGRESPHHHQLFPCCGFDVYLYQGRLALPGCPSGANVTVLHDRGRVRLSTAAVSAEVMLETWRAAVLGFAREVEAFYARCTPKQPAQDAKAREGWAEFWREWRERDQELAGTAK